MHCYDILKNEEKWERKKKTSNFDNTTHETTPPASSTEPATVASIMTHNFAKAKNSPRVEPAHSDQDTSSEEENEVEETIRVAKENNSKAYNDGATADESSEEEASENENNLEDDEGNFEEIKEDHKEPQQHSNIDNSQNDAIIRIQRAMLAIKREKVKQEYQRMECETMMVDVENISNPKRRYYWEAKQEEILNSFRKEEIKLKREMMVHETMMLDPNTISDPDRRHYWKRKQRKIMREA